MELFETRDFLWPPPPPVLTRAREVIFIETPLILPPSPHLIPNTTNPGMSADSGLFDGWGREATLDATVLINGELGWGCYSGAGGCQWVYNIFEKLQTWSINKNINPQHTVSFGQVPWRALQLAPDLNSFKEFPGRVESTCGFVIFLLEPSIVSAYTLNICSPTLWKPPWVEAPVRGAISWTDCCTVTIGNSSYSGAFLVQTELENEKRFLRVQREDWEFPELENSSNPNRGS